MKRLSLYIRLPWLWLALLLTGFVHGRALADECHVTDTAANGDIEKSIGEALRSARAGECSSDRALYRNRYARYFQGQTIFQVIRFSRSLAFDAEHPFVLSWESGIPLVLVTDEGAEVRISGAPIVLKGRNIILDGLHLESGPDALRLEGKHHLLLRNRIRGAKQGVVVEGEEHRLIDNDISHHQTGVVLVDREADCEDRLRASEKIIYLSANALHDNDVGVIAEAHGIQFEAWLPYEDEGKAKYGTALLGNSNGFGGRIFKNKKGIVVAALAADCSKDLAIMSTAFDANDIDVESAFAFPQPVRLAAVNIDGQKFSLSGSLPIASALPSVRIDLAVVTATGAVPIASNPKIDVASGRFQLEVVLPQNLVPLYFTAMATDLEYGVSSLVTKSLTIEKDAVDRDADSDGLTDVQEDFNRNGLVDIFSGETDPLDPDTDRDGLSDGDERLKHGLVKQLSLQGKLDSPDRLNPTNPDSDADGIPDGVEAGVQSVDQDPQSQTDPTSADTDRDGLADGSEDSNFNGRRDEQTMETGMAAWVESDPNVADSDHDGVPDGQEIPGGTLKEDADGDGILDGEEKRLGTGVDVCDSDHDGLSDGVEVGAITIGDEGDCHGLTSAGTNYRTPKVMDPLNRDSDGDGIDDGVEDVDGNGWIDTQETDPSNADTDGDGLSDGAERLGDFDDDRLPDFEVRGIVGGAGCSPPGSIADVDCDAIPNARDDDSDNDGCADRDEGGWKDQNNNGVPDVFDNQAKACAQPQTSTGRTGGSSIASKPSGSTTPPNAAASLPTWVTNTTGGGACSLNPRASKNEKSALPLMFAFMILLMRRISFKKS
ncbi:MAG: hypothetical protein HY540_02490 [Deltaproteobacteria bacterium]|nr:hypothetical protein [Deltaproteobacteria bacterium]